MDYSVRLKIDLKIFKLGDNFSLRDITFQLNKGEGIALLGPSGSGKTTLLKVIDGLYKTYQGSILLDGKEIKELKPKEIYQKMGLLFQNPEEQLFADKVYDDVAFGPRNMGWAEEKIKEMVKKALEIVNLKDYEERTIETLSFGEKKRIALAGLLAMGQEILLLDEPTLGLDPFLEEKFIKLLQKLKDKGYSFIIATHNVEIVPSLADKIVVLKEGKMVFFGTPPNLFIEKKALLPHFNLQAPLPTEIFYPFKNVFPKIPLNKEVAIELLENLLKNIINEKDGV